MLFCDVDPRYPEPSSDTDIQENVWYTLPRRGIRRAAIPTVRPLLG